MCFRTKQNQKNMLQEHKGVDKDGASFWQECHSTQWVKLHILQHDIYVEHSSICA